MKQTVLSRLLRPLFAGGGALGLAALALPAHAQVAQPAGPIARVEVTGTLIRRAEAETSSSVLTLNRADIERSGKTTVAELLQTLAVDNQGSVPMSFGSGFAAGASGISLRGLGAASTLVLINGRRVAPYGLADDGQKMFADLNIIPSEAIERVEVLKTGASSLYGSDAIAGVVNVILRRDFTGTSVRASHGQSREGDGNDSVAAVTHGFGDIANDRFNILMSLEYGRRDEIWYRDRADRGHIGRVDLRPWGYSAQQALGGTGAIVDNNLAGSSIVGNVRNPDTLDYYSRANPAGVGFARLFPGAACANFTSHPQGDPGGGCLIDSTLADNQIQPSQERINFFTRGTLQINSAWQAYGELNLYRSESKSSSTPSGIHGSVGYPGGPVSNAAIALGPPIRTTPTPAAPRGCAILRPTSGPASATSNRTSSALSPAPKERSPAGKSTPACCSRKTTSATSAAASSSATWRSRCSIPARPTWLPRWPTPVMRHCLPAPSGALPKAPG